ncbi:MAG TPA: hypothetical protein VLB44_16090 [Kofleriaceae bacterium]|nr:hypothetical protein [Kofleriaceae bacterium]
MRWDTHDGVDGEVTEPFIRIASFEGPTTIFDAIDEDELEEALELADGSTVGPTMQMRASRSTMELRVPAVRATSR